MLVKEFRVSDGVPCCVAFTSDGRLLAVACANQAIHIYDAASTTLLRTLNALPRWPIYVFGMFFTPDSKRIAFSAGFDKIVQVFNVESGDYEHTFRHESICVCSAFSPDSHFLASGIAKTATTPHMVSVWRMSDKKLLHNLVGHTGVVFSVAVSPDGQYVVSGGTTDNLAIVWRIVDGVMQCKIEHSNHVYGVAVTPDSQHIATGCSDGVVRLFYIATGKLSREFFGQKDVVWFVAVDRHHVFSCSRNQTICMWNLANTRSSRTLRCAQKITFGVACHPNGKQIATVSDGMVKLWTVCEWSDRDHHLLFSDEFKALVFQLMCCKTRVENSEKGQAPLPLLPMAMWLTIFGFLCELYRC